MMASKGIKGITDLRKGSMDSTYPSSPAMLAKPFPFVSLCLIACLPASARAFINSIHFYSGMCRPGTDVYTHNANGSPSSPMVFFASGNKWDSLLDDDEDEGLQFIVSSFLMRESTFYSACL